MKKVEITEYIDSLLKGDDKGSIYEKVMQGTEKALIEKALERSFGNQSIAAKILGITRNTLRMKIKRFDINVKRYKI